MLMDWEETKKTIFEALGNFYSIRDLSRDKVPTASGTLSSAMVRFL